MDPASTMDPTVMNLFDRLDLINERSAVVDFLLSKNKNVLDKEMDYCHTV